MAFPAICSSTHKSVFTPIHYNPTSRYTWQRGDDLHLPLCIGKRSLSLDPYLSQLRKPLLLCFVVVGNKHFGNTHTHMRICLKTQTLHVNHLLLALCQDNLARTVQVIGNLHHSSTKDGIRRRLTDVSFWICNATTRRSRYNEVEWVCVKTQLFLPVIPFRRHKAGEPLSIDTSPLVKEPDKV